MRKFAIAVVTEDARTMSASLIPLMSATDPQTVRQSLLALGEARATWASPAIARCLDHPDMNVKKTAAEVLARVGTPQAVPGLLFWLGRHDNPGFRDALTVALQKILGKAFVATITTAASQSTEERTRDLLKKSLPGLDQRSSDIDTLLDDGWDDEVARRVIRKGTYDVRLRHFPHRWLDLVASGDSVQTIQFFLRLYQAPWSTTELDAFASRAPTLVNALPAADVLEPLEAAIPRLNSSEKARLAEQARALQIGRAGLAIMRFCNVTPTRYDLDRALMCEGEEEFVLREAFRQEPLPDNEKLYILLTEAIRAPTSLSNLRSNTAGTSRERLDALIRVFPEASPTTRPILLDWMLNLQPLGKPSWTLAEEAIKPVRSPRVPQLQDLDQPRSMKQRDRLLAMLNCDSQQAREDAARILLDWPEPDIQRVLLGAYLDGSIETLPQRAAYLLSASNKPCGRFAILAGTLPADDLDDLVPALLDAWEHGDRATHDAAAQALRRAHADTVARTIATRLQDNAWGVLDVISGRPVLLTPTIEVALQRAPKGVRDKVVLRDDLLRAPDTDMREAKVLAELRERHPATSIEPSREDLYHLARGENAKASRWALNRLAEQHDERPDAELAPLLAQLISHAETKVRLQAHRLSRRVLDKPVYLQQTLQLLDDPEDNVVRSAVETLKHASYTPAIPKLVKLLSHANNAVRASTEKALLHIGEAAIPELRHAESHARPDRRATFSNLIDRIHQATPTD